jgi:hypothetical protein
VLNTLNRCVSPSSNHSNSAPPSPSAHSASNAHQVSPASTSSPGQTIPSDDKCFNQGFQTNVLQHQFEQFKMVNDFGETENVHLVRHASLVYGYITPMSCSPTYDFTIMNRCMDQRDTQVAVARVQALGVFT